MIDHDAVHMALRARFLTLEVCTTGSATIEATSSGYVRSGGNFNADGFVVGMEVTPTGFTQTARGVINAMSDTILTIQGGRTAEAAASGRSLAVGPPELAAYENLIFRGRVVKRPYWEEAYVPSPPTMRSMPAAGGLMEESGLYVIRWYGVADVGSKALATQADKVLRLFKPGLSLLLADGYSVRVLEQGPYRGQIREDEPGWSVVVVTVPWRLFHVND